AKQSLKRVEVILVDSGSTDHTLEIASQYPVRVVRIQPEEFTFGYSLNQGISAAHGDLIIIASAHVYPVYPDWLERLVAPFADVQVGLVYGKQRGNSLNKFSEQQIFHHWYPDHSQHHQPYPFCNNANAAIRRSIWESQHYDETLPGLEDLEWAHRIMSQRYAISYVAEAEVVHVHEETPTGVYNRYRREAMAFKRLFPQENYHLWDLAHNLTTNISSDLVHAARQAQLTARLGEIFWFRWMQFWGTYRGYHQSGPLTWQLRQTFYYPRGIGTLSDGKTREISPIQYYPEDKNHPQPRKHA
ncbi:MAG TPA: glycosyltransferase family 2 protein, partial [Anaerolineales bacterium]|nr:glycosyltransferase family 2 protein [Anaerolineales bacterium]